MKKHSDKVQDIINMCAVVKNSAQMITNIMAVDFRVSKAQDEENEKRLEEQVSIISQTVAEYVKYRKDNRKGK